MQSSWARDRKICVGQVSITPQVLGRIAELNIKDNQLVNAGDFLLTIDKTPSQIVELDAQAQLAKAQSNPAKANNEANRHHHLSQNLISVKELDTANLNIKTMQASVDAAQTTLKQAQWQLAQTEVRVPVSGWMINLTTCIGNYADTGKPLFALVDSHSSYVIDCLKEIKLCHIREGAPAQIILYSNNKTLRGHVSGIGRAIYDRSVESDSSLVPDVKPNVPWIRLARRIPARFALDKISGDVTLVSGTICSITVGQ